MNKLTCGIAALGIMASSAFADYDIITLGATVTTNPKTAYNDYIFLYGTGGLEPGNAKDADGFIAFDAGFAVIKPIVQKSGTAIGDYDAVALGIDNATTATPNMNDCSGGFSYEYKGDVAHNFELKFDPALCGGTDENEGSNKWGKKAVPANASLTTVTITKTDLQNNGLINTWETSKCQSSASSASTVDLAKVLQMAWVVEGKSSGSAALGKTLTIGTVKCLGGTLPSSSSVAASGSSSSEATTTSSSSVAGTTSSSSTTTTTSSSSGTDTSSSSSEDPDHIISHNNAPVVGLNIVHFARSLQIASGKDATVSLFDISGKQVLNQRVLSGVTTISLEKQKMGVYYAVAKSGAQKQIVKIVLK